MHRRKLGSLLLLAALGALGGCSEQQPAITRVEPYVLQKSLFSGEWYFGQTVVDVPGTMTLTTVGNTNYRGVYRIRWDIQESYLYARKAEELVEGAKGVDAQTGEYKGTIVGTWKILKHFDLRKGYNPSTGEQNNVLEENTTDCKWYDCKYLRVDWSENQALDYNFLDGNEYFEKMPMPFYGQDASDARWRPVFDARNGYIDVTSALVVKPASIYIPGWDFHYPFCWFNSNSECTPEVIKLRSSFWRRDPNRDFEPRDHSGPYDEWFGFFVAERLVYENHYGVNYRAKKKLINRHNLWERHHHDTPEAACVAKDGDAACSRTFGAGSRCDTLMRFHKQDVATDTDGDGLPDSFETAAGLDPRAADGNRNLVPDGSEDRVSFGQSGLEQKPNGVPDVQDFWAWDSASMEHRCTIPMAKREPLPVAYFNTGFFPRSLVCDEDRGNPSQDKVAGACQAWSFIKPADRASGASVLHKTSLDYDETFWRTFLRGVWGFSVDEYNTWIATHDVSRLPADKQEILRKFGDDELGYYAFSICPNNPVQETDPWPCRFPHLTFAKAKELMSQGRKFSTTDEQGKEAAPTIRLGDLRYSMVNYVKDYYDGWALLGLGPSMTDPVTGENLAGVANVYALNDWAATTVQEMVQLLNTQISPTDFVNGVNLDNFLAKLKESNAHEIAGVGSSRVYSPAEMTDLYQSVRQSWLGKLFKGGDRKAVFPALSFDQNGQPLGNRALKNALVGRMAGQGVLQAQGKLRDLSVIAGTPLEKLLVDEEVLQASGFAPGAVKDLTPAVLGKASLARGGFLREARALQALKSELSHKRAMCFVDMIDDGLEGLATRLKDLPADKIWTTARETIMRAVLTHEMGHTFGLHHNWAGTDDALNFHDEFWKLRSENDTHKNVCQPDGGNKATAICPFSISPMTATMKNPGGGLKSLWEYGYSSVMDYNAKYTNDGNGLGKYDKAAIMYGHVDKVEVFESLGGMPRPKGGDNVFDEWFTSSANPFWLPPPDYPLKSFHYTSWYSQMGKVAFDERNRKIVDYRELKELSDGGGKMGWFYVDGKTTTQMPRVPFAFCTYTRGDIADSCNTRDYGADHYERMKGDVDTWDTWYVLRAFPRFQYGADKYEYISRNHRRYERLKQYNDTYALNTGLLTQWWDPAEIQTFMTDRVNGWGNYTIAVHDAFNVAMRTLAMPDVKGYELLTRPDGQRIFAEAEFRLNYRSDISNSRYFSSSWSGGGTEDCGLMWWECQHHNGFYLDKVMALFNLSDPHTRFAAVDTAEDIRKWRIGFFENWSKQLVDFFGGVLSEDYDAIAPWIDPTKPANKVTVDASGVTWTNQMAWRYYGDPAKDPKKPSSGGAVEAATRFTFQVYAAVMGILLFQDNFDNDFVERARLWKKGKDTTWTIKPVPGKVDGVAEFDDPFNGSTYVGIAYTDGKGIAQRMINHANKLKQHTSWCNQTTGLADSCEAVPTSYGCDQACMRQRAEDNLYRYRQLLDIVVQVITIHNDNGGAWSWPPWHP